MNQMTDDEFLLHAYRGDRAAVDLAMVLRHVSHLLDDLIDGDKEIAGDTVVQGFWDMLIVIPANPFYIAHGAVLRPLMASALVNWQTANALERGGLEDRHIAHSLRYDLASVLCMIAFLIGGRKWAEHVGPEMRRRCQRDTLKSYIAELDKRHPREKAK